MEIRDYQLGDEAEILKLFKVVFGREMKPAYWKWRFVDNPSGKLAIKLMWDNNKIVGHYATSPTIVSVDGKLLKGSLSMTTMTHPDYAGKGIFKTLALALFDELQKAGHDFVMGFPNKNSHYGFIKNLGWTNLTVQNHLSCLYHRGSALGEYEVKYVNNFNDKHSEELEKVLSKYSRIHTYRSLEYLQWRYEQNPNNKYHIFECYQSGEYLGLVVVKSYCFLDDGRVEYFIVENGLEKEHLPAIFNVLEEICSMNSIDELVVNTWLSLFDNRFIYYEKNGFVLSQAKPTILCVNMLSNGESPLLDFRNWGISYGDSDVY